MSEPDISTLARRLAEQNNVDWRALSGSGPEGKVVERDVLDFLARVMAGDEALDPTPEPVPEGMESWPEQDIQTFRAGVGEAATLGELRDEIGHASRDYLTASDVAHDDGTSETADTVASDAYVSRVEAPVTATIDEDIFLFDDDDVVEPQPLEPAVTEVSDAVHTTDDLDELLVAGDDDDLVADVAAIESDAPTAGDADGVRFGAVETGFLGEDHGDADAGVDAVGSFHDGFQRSDDGDEGVDSGSFAARTDVTDPVWGSDISLGDRSAGVNADSADVPDLWGPESTDQADSELWTAAGAPTEASDEPYVTEHVPADGVHEEFAATDTHRESEDAFVAAEEGFVFTSEAEPSTDLDVSQEPVEESGDEAVFATHDESVPPVEPGAYDEPVVHDGGASGIEAGLAAVGATMLSSGAASLPLARPGTILRRNIDVSPLAAAQLAVGQELGYEEPLSAAAFLLRAVAKAADSSGFDSGATGLAVLGSEVTIRRVFDAATTSFGSLVSSLDDGPDGASSGEEGLGLVAADLSGLDVDEVVLELGVPVISLGRILYDNQRGAYKSTLTLTGPMPLDRAAGLLARVAELLDAPVRLVL